MADFAEEDFDLDYELRRIDLGNGVGVNAARVVNQPNNVVVAVINPEANQADAAAPAMDVDPEQAAHHVANEPEHEQPGQPPVGQLRRLAEPAQQPPVPAQLPQQAQQGQQPAGPAQLPQPAQLQGQPPAQPAQLRRPAQLQGHPPAQPAQQDPPAQPDQHPAQAAHLAHAAQPAQHANGERRPRGRRAGWQWRQQQERTAQKNMDNVAALMLALSKACTNAQRFRNHPYRDRQNN